MKKFLISFIIGVVFMAIGTTSLIFELNEFERVSISEDVKANKKYFDTETISLDDEKSESLDIVFKRGSYASYDVVYDNSLKDEVKISFYKDIKYSVHKNSVTVLDSDYYDGLQFFGIIMDGLKEHKIYNDGQAPIIIQISQENYDRMKISYEDY